MIFLFCRDSNGRDCFFDPIAVLEHRGSITTDGETRGHYTCDIKHKDSGQWYRTNDDRLPKMITEDEVSKLGYIILLKRTTLNSQ